MNGCCSFLYTPSDFIYSVKSEASLTNSSKFDEELQRSWSQAREDGYFRYHLDKLQTKVIPGRFRFIEQLNLKRAVERRKPENITSVNEPFNPDKFNFTKIKKEEVLFKVKNDDENVDDDEMDSNFLIINVSPLEYCNSLLVASLHRCHPQIMISKALKLAIEMTLLSSTPCFKIGFNSLGACASVNHLHFHMYYLQHNLYIETAPVQKLSGECYELRDFPAIGFVFQLHDRDIDNLVSSIMKLACYCLKKSIPHNIMITRGTDFNSTDLRTYDTVRVYFWARKAFFGSKNDLAFNPAVCELSGHLPIKVQSMFGTMDEADITSIFKDICEEIFFQVRDDVKTLFE
ncbi:GDPGP1 (predicted) [Pycnogonum litorale]